MRLITRPWSSATSGCPTPNDAGSFQAMGFGAPAVANRLSGGTCRVVTSDQRLKVDATGLYTYPDVLVFCGPPRMEDGVHHTLTNPVLAAEVLSDSSEKYDRGIRFGHYRRLDSLQEYLLIAQDRFSVEVFAR